MEGPLTKDADGAPTRFENKQVLRYVLLFNGGFLTADERKKSQQVRDPLKMIFFFLWFRVKTFF